MFHWEIVYVRACGFFFSYSLLSGRENKRREKDEDRCGITADCQKPGNDEPTTETKKKKKEKKK